MEVDRAFVLAASPSELLTAQFYLWEQRGRGWSTWPHRVELEPPFSPFPRHWVPRRGRAGIDDGRRPSLLGRVGEHLEALLSRRSQAPDEIDEWLSSVSLPNAPLDGDSDGVVELRLAVPPGLKVIKEVVAQLLSGLSLGSGPLSFEVVGGVGQVSVQLAVRNRDAAAVRQQVLAYFPEITVSEVTGHLAALWRQGTGEGVVVDFGLCHEFVLPLRTLRSFDADPLSGVAGALSNLEPDETGVLQVLLQPVQSPWAESVPRAVLDNRGKPFFEDAPQIVAGAREKLASPLFAALIRVGAHSPDPERAWHLAQNLGGALRVLDQGGGNSLIPLACDDYDPWAHERDLLERRTHRSGMLLNLDEVLTLVHPPSASVRVETLVREARPTRAAPAVATGQGLILGRNTHAGRTVDVALTPDQRSRHMYVVGASGTGKSTLLLNCILQDLEHGDGVAVLDPHGDLVDQVIARLPDHRLKDVILLDPADAEYPVGFNILSARTELERTLLSSDLVAAFQRLATSWGDQMTSVLGNAILAYLESESGGTLADLRRFLVERPYREQVLATVKDPDVVYYWEKEFPLLHGKPQAPILTRLDMFLRPKLIRCMVAQKEDRLDFADIMNSGKVFLGRLSAGAIGEENAYLLGTLLVSRFQQTAMSRQEMAEADRRPFYLYIDEFHNFITPTMAQILSGARKYRLGLILAHQDLRQISQDPQVLNSVLSNPFTRVCFRVGDHDAKALAEGFASFDARDLQNLSTGQAICRVERSNFDFTLDTIPLGPVDVTRARATAERVVAHSRASYARTRVEVEAALHGTQGRAGEVVTQPSPKASPRPPVETYPTVREGLATQVSKELTSVPPPSVEIPKAGRGGQQHRYVQELIRRWAESRDWRATIEESILDGMGSVDVALRKGEHSVACEVAITSPPEHEVENIQKCLAAGFTRVVSVVPDKKALARIQDLATAAISEADVARVVFCSPEEAFAAVEQFEAEASGGTKTVRGYKVRVKYKAQAESDTNVKRQAVSQVIARALKRIKE